MKVKLIDAPEQGYFLTDQPLARGEICVKKSSNTPGYFNVDDNAQVFTDDGYFRTGSIFSFYSTFYYNVFVGDIGERDYEGKIRVIDRVKSVLKLAQGKYVSPERYIPQ